MRPDMQKENPTVPLSTVIDNMARLKYIVQTTLMHMKETEEVPSGDASKGIEG